jgi:hypothetical protein
MQITTMSHAMAPALTANSCYSVPTNLPRSFSPADVVRDWVDVP